MTYDTAHIELKRALPHLKPCVERFEATEGAVVEPLPLTTLFEGVLGQYFEVIIPATPEDVRDQLIREGLLFVEQMANGDEELATLAAIGVCESIVITPGWTKVVRGLAGPATAAFLHPWGEPEAGRNPIDLWGVRDAAASRGLDLNSLPGVSHPSEHRRLPSLAAARRAPDGVLVFFSPARTKMLAIVPGHRVATDDDLEKIDRLIGNTRVEYYTVPSGERVLGLKRPGEEDGRWNGGLYLHPSLTPHLDQISRYLRTPDGH